MGAIAELHLVARVTLDDARRVRVLPVQFERVFVREAAVALENGHLGEPGVIFDFRHLPIKKHINPT